jgi:spermidine/putrescine transport system permease protein
VTITAPPATPAPPTEVPTPAPQAPPKAPRRKFRSRLLGIWAFLVYVWLFAPIVVMIVFSFNKPTGKFNITWNEFTLDN